LERDRGTLTFLHSLDTVPMGLEAAHAHGLAGGQKPERRLELEGTRPHGSGHDAAGAADREGAVDGKTKEIAHTLARPAERLGDERAPELRQSRSGGGGHAHDRWPREWSAVEND